ncbi:MAG: glycerol-3-phosphate acyltransferase PlsY [Chloroflexi bacterium]|nr:MAG: glycerol-3-phosphate acyltransferase PlsY [Chloroflexota bacterium]
MTEALAVALAYFIGAIPLSWLIFYWRSGGQDLRRVGDRNVGSGNALREGAGWFWGHMALLGDVGKGLLAVSLARWLELPVGWWMACGYVVIVGHMFPVWLGFDGGRGAATAMGAAGAFLPWQFGITMAGGTVAFLLFRIAELGIVLVAAPLPFLAIAFDLPVEAIVFCFTAPMLSGVKAGVDRWQRSRRAVRVESAPADDAR